MSSFDQIAEASADYLRAGELVPVGYRNTEAGVIPEDWTVRRLGELAVFIGSGTTNTKETGEYPLFGSTGLIGTCTAPIYEGEAILVARVGANAGKLNFVSGQYGVSDNTIILRLDSEINIIYLKYWLLRKNLNSLVFGSGQPLITGTQIKSLPLAIPPQKEQAAIAKALSDIDELLTSLNKFIAKKQAIKTATMQQLLTGKTRLPAFALREDGTRKGYTDSELGEIPEDWNIKNIEDIATVKGGKRLPKGEQLLTTPTKHPYIRVADMFYGGVTTDDLRFVPEHVAPLIKNYTMNENEIFISVAGTLGIVGKIPKLLNGANLTENADRISTEINPDFLLYWLMAEKIQNEIAQQSTVGAQPKLALARIQQFPVPVPLQDREQAAIATILSDMHIEIQTLEKRLFKTRQIKQGMMQELLTGKTRLIQGSEAR
ncbi:MAG: restriction endonuclease [unclassified Hahellaceae]|nr:restriction endonuclease [Hahellaceae bacterium]|tara:strand:- start:25663 stop:26958 length:1296 start_codon:yes stop_codon:yes gene_type:complete